ncbi:ABC transporter permease [Nocardioides sp.]|jgi:simple sugar transport system permease protein|uniref:ABC transporter permease n=1 Tax=Nocardioides sp. TaxID=35761 RepID=UPI002C79D1F8|nr:ABC transporter permease [Nocardioides sp.]HVX54372.1 ABC transporter permease [Nocardioides sp.]
MSTTQAPAQTPAVPEAPRAKRRGSAWDTALVTVLSFVTALVISAILIAISDQQTRSSFKYFGHYPGDTFRFAWSAIWHTYQALFYGAIFNPHTAGNGTLAGYLGPISETLTDATPLIAGGLAVGLAFRAGLFNIGGQGQIILGAIFAGFVGFHWHMPVVIHLIVAILAGVLGGALWGGLSGFLKAKTGAHEVITTIMLNYVAVNLLGYLLSVKGFQAPPYGQAISNPVDHNATLPLLLGGSLRVHLGLILSLAAAAFVWWLLKYSRLGFRLRAVGANPFAAKTAGMHVENSYVVVMLLSGALCGLAGVSQVLGTNPQITGDIDAGIGFDAITVALLGRANPVGTVFAGLLFGALHAGGPMMQQYAPIELVQVIQSLIVLFIAAPAVIRAIFRLKTSGASVGAELAKGWNG